MTTTLNKQIEIVVNLGNYQSIRITSGKTVELDGDWKAEDADRRSDQLTEEIAADLRRSLTKTLQTLGRKTDPAPDKFAEACQTKLAGGSTATQTQPKTQ